MTFKHIQNHHNGADRQVQQGHVGGHHVDGGDVHIKSCKC